MFLGDLYNTTADFCRQLNEEFPVTGRITAQPTSDVVCRSYKAGVMIQVWVEKMLNVEDSLTWELDISQQHEGWLVDARVCRVTDSGTNTVLQFADEVIPTFAVVEREVPIMLNRLYDAGLRILSQELKPMKHTVLTDRPT
jgi:hypothetical protein